ncbi:hypothetical protein [Pseudodesulfovibrio sediminis]|nr:hypothetical protein [Pseudodesulfovibrio sediminis]
MAEAVKEFIGGKIKGDPWLKQNITKRNLNGFIRQLNNILDFAYRNPKNTTGFGLTGYTYHIKYKLLANFKQNKIGKYFSYFLDEAEDEGSTYHANNAWGKEKNGYCRWYRFHLDLIIILAMANRNLLRACGFSKTRIHHINEADYTIPAVPSDFEFNSAMHLRINRKIFRKEVFLFNKFHNFQVIYLIRQVIYQDEDFFYFKNFISSGWEHGLNEIGRDYTVVGQLKRVMRKRVFADYIEVDINAAMQSTFLWLISLDSRKKWYEPDYDKIRKDLPMLHKLTGTSMEKNKVRALFAKTFNVDIVDAKLIILQLTVAPGSNVIRKYCKDKPPKTKKMARILANKLSKECNLVRKILLDRWYDRTTNENPNFRIGTLLLRDLPEMIDEVIKLGDSKRIKGGRGRSRKDRTMFRIYEAVERQIRIEMIRFLRSKGIDEVYQIHDCVIFPRHAATEPSTLEMLSEHIRKKIGCRLGFSHEVYNQANQNKDVQAENKKISEEVRRGINPAAYLGHEWAQTNIKGGHGDEKFPVLDTDDLREAGRFARIKVS